MLIDSLRTSNASIIFTRKFVKTEFSNNIFSATALEVLVTFFFVRASPFTAGRRSDRIHGITPKRVITHANNGLRWYE